MQRPEAGTVAEEDGAVEEEAEEVEASVTAEAKVVPWVVVREVVQWAVRVVVREAAPKVRRLEVREAFQPASPRERLLPVLEGGRLQGRSVNRSPSPEARLAAYPKEERSGTVTTWTWPLPWLKENGC